jgi:hypothetical protein
MMDISRRTLLRLLGLTGASYFVPSLLGRTNVLAAPSGVPRRILFYYNFQGTMQELWSPKGTETNWELGQLHSGTGSEDTGLQNYKSQLVFLEGLTMGRADKAGAAGANGHVGGATLALSGYGRQSPSRAGGISIDQFIAKQLATQGIVRPIEQLILGVKDQYGINGDEGSSTYSGPGSQLPIEQDATKIFNGNAFKSIPATPNTAPDPAELKRIANQKSVLDYVQKDFAKAMNGMSKMDRDRLQVHADAVRDLEVRLSASVGGGASCMRPDGTFGRDWTTILDAHFRVVQTAFACDLTRVITLYVEAPEDGAVFGLPGANGQSFHEQHVHAANPVTVPRYHRFTAKHFRRMLDMLSAITEPDGSTMLDNTIVFWCNQLGTGASHETNAMPYVLAGGKNMGLRGGRYLKFNGRPHSDLFTSLANMMGVNVSKYGDPNLCTGPLPLT